MNITYFLLPVFSLLVGFQAQEIGNRLRVIDQPDGFRKNHKFATPLVGGIAIVLPFLAACALQLWQNPDNEYLVALMIAAAGAFLLGFRDDRKRLPASMRLIAGTALVFVSLTIAPVYVVEQFDFSFLSEVMPLHWFSIVFSVLVIVGMKHAMNMVDGMNGLACGICLIWSVFFWFYAPAPIIYIVISWTICLFVTLIFNLSGKLFLGNSGAYASAIITSFLAILIYNTTERTIYADGVVVWFMVPVLDCLRLMVTRIAEGRSPASPDLNHLHHRLLRLLPAKYVLLIYWSLIAVPGAITLVVPSVTPIAVLGVCGIYAMVIILTSHRFATMKN